MYTLLRTGEFGKTWRVIIIASVMFALLQALRMAESLDWNVASHGLSQIAELMFALSLAYAFYLQRKAFTHAASLRGPDERRGEPRANARGSRNHDEMALAPDLVADAAPPKSDEFVAASQDDEESAAALALHDLTDIEWDPQNPAE